MIGEAETIWAVLHVETPLPIGMLRYPLLPWVGVMAAGTEQVTPVLPQRRSGRRFSTAPGFICRNRSRADGSR